MSSTSRLVLAAAVPPAVVLACVAALVDEICSAVVEIDEAIKRLESEASVV